MNISQWSFGRVFLVSFLWAVVVLGFFVVWVLMLWRAYVSADSGIAGLSAGAGSLITLALLMILPPIVLFAIWVAQRRHT